MEAPSTTYRFDPQHPVPTIGGGVSRRLKDGAYDQRERVDMPGSRAPYLPLRSRSDVVVFETTPLDHDVSVAGPVEIELYAASTGTDTDFTAKVVDVNPNTGEPLGANRRWQVVDNTIYHDATRASVLKLFELPQSRPSARWRDVRRAASPEHNRPRPVSPGRVSLLRR